MERIVVSILSAVALLVGASYGATWLRLYLGGAPDIRDVVVIAALGVLAIGVAGAVAGALAARRRHKSGTLLPR